MKKLLNILFIYCCFIVCISIIAEMVIFSIRLYYDILFDIKDTRILNYTAFMFAWIGIILHLMMASGFKLLKLNFFDKSQIKE